MKVSVSVLSLAVMAVEGLTSYCPSSCVADRDKWTVYHDWNALVMCPNVVIFDYVLPNRSAAGPVTIRACLGDKSGNSTKSLEGDEGVRFLSNYQGISVASVIDAAPVIGVASVSQDKHQGKHQDVMLPLKKFGKEGVQYALYDSAVTARVMCKGQKSKYFSDNVSNLASVEEKVRQELVTCGNSVKAHLLIKRAACSTVTVVSGDSCYSLSLKCNITPALFDTYNPGICDSLQVGQKVCCSVGTLTPNPNPDGSCYSYKVASGDYCSLIAASNSLTVDKIEQYNKNTYGWFGCGNLQVGQMICVSSGTPPRPTSDPNAVCGPLAGGDKYGSECPLKACCSQWGYCGTTSEFCSVVTSSTGAPGTHGCESNCGTDIVSGSPPSQFVSIGYYEGWNGDRPCLNMEIDDIDVSKYSHVHYAFVNMDNNFNPIVNLGELGKWREFTRLSGVKKIASFGGWAFSNEPGTYAIFTDAVTDANRNLFAQKVVNWMTANNLDGLDFDWEYPGATDIPGVSGRGPNDGVNYLNFLRYVRSILPVGKSLSIAAPASYWYLKNFPIADMAPLLDYIVYMTYDLHGQWDYNIPSLGPYLRSHVNLTEVKGSLSMITKAGVPSSKVVVGVASYGRSFKQVDPNCSTPECKFTGPDSGATPGKCTRTGGYIANAEIDEILTSGNYRNYAYDVVSDSDVMLYGIDQWVAWTSVASTSSRTNLYRNLAMGGTVEWAMDLARDYGKGLNPKCKTSGYPNLFDLLEGNSLTCTSNNLLASIINDMDEANQIGWSLLSNLVPVINTAISVVNQAMPLVLTQNGKPDITIAITFANPQTSISNFMSAVNTWLSSASASELSGGKSNNPKDAIAGLFGIMRPFTRVPRIIQTIISGGIPSSRADALAVLLGVAQMAGDTISSSLQNKVEIENMIKSIAQASEEITNNIRSGNGAGFGGGSAIDLPSFNTCTNPIPIMCQAKFGDRISKSLDDISKLRDSIINSPGSWIPESHASETTEQQTREGTSGDDINRDQDEEPEEEEEICTADNTNLSLKNRNEVEVVSNRNEVEVVSNRNEVVSNRNEVVSHHNNTNLIKRNDAEVALCRNKYTLCPEFYAKLAMLKIPDNDSLPSYVVNMNGNSMGVACNAAFYILTKGLEGSKIFTLRPRSTNKRERRPQLTDFTCCKKKGIEGDAKKYDRDEFPFSAMNEGKFIVGDHPLYDISILCVNSSENQSDGASFGNFLAKAGPYISTNPLVEGSPKRSGIIQEGERFNVLINITPEQFAFTCCDSIHTVKPLRVNNLRLNAFMANLIP